MATTSVLMAGFGGQGVLLAGKILAHAAMECGLEVSWLPSYGPEMRGGTAYCTVVVSDREIGSPVINTPANVVVFNRPSLEKFGPKVKPHGLLIINSSLIEITSERDDLELFAVKRERAISKVTQRLKRPFVLHVGGEARVDLLQLSGVELVGQHLDLTPLLGEHLADLRSADNVEAGLDLRFRRGCRFGALRRLHVVAGMREPGLEHLETIPESNLCLRIDDYLMETLHIKDNVIKNIKVTYQPPPAASHASDD